MYHSKVREECIKYMSLNRQDYEKVKSFFFKESKFKIFFFLL